MNGWCENVIAMANNQRQINYNLHTEEDIVTVWLLCEDGGDIDWEKRIKIEAAAMTMKEHVNLVKEPKIYPEGA